MTDSEKLDLLLAEMQNMKEDIAEVKQKVSRMDLTMENELRVNIRRIAEGHLDLSRNLHEAMRIDSEKEMLSIRVTMLESELRNIKARLDHIA